MFNRLVALTIFLILALAAQNARAADPFAKPELRNEPVVATIKGESVSQIFAIACQGNTFAEFQAWSQRNHFTLRQFDSPFYQISANEIKDEELLFSVKINDQNNWEANIRDQKFIGNDPCETAMAYLNTREPKSLTKEKLDQHHSLSQNLIKFLLPEARAEKLVNETTTINWLLGALATAAITDGKFIENLSAKFNLPSSYLLTAAFRATNTAEQKSATTNLDQLLAQQTELICSRNRTKIFGASNSHILVKKGYTPYRLGFEDNQSEKPLKNESRILASGKVHDHLVSLAQRCNQEADASQINAQLQAERETLSLKIAKVNRGVDRAISSETPGIK